MDIYVGVSRFDAASHGHRVGSLIAAKIVEAKTKLPKPPYGQKWEQSGRVEEIGPRDGIEFLVPFKLMEDRTARRKFRENNRRRWAAWTK